MASTKAVADTLVRRLRRWGTASVVVGGALTLSPRTRAFGVQTAMWGAVDLGLAMFAVRRGAAPKRRPLRRLLLINTALDVGYVAAGAHLAVRRPTFGGVWAPPPRAVTAWPSSSRAPHCSCSI